MLAAIITLRLSTLHTQAASFSFAKSAMNAYQPAGAAFLQVTRTGNLSETATVEYQTVSGTAQAELDFTPTSGTLVFAPNQTNALVQIPLLVNDSREPGATFTLVLTNASPGSSLDSPAVATVAIAELFVHPPLQDPSGSALRALINQGGHISFAFSASIKLTNTLEIGHDTVLDASGANVAISGQGLVQVLQVREGVTLVLRNLRVFEGWSASGAGLHNDGGTVIIDNCRFDNNRAQGEGGGAIFNEGTLTITRTVFTSNSDLGVPGRLGRGGALVNAGPLFMSASTFKDNTARGGAGIAPGSDIHSSAGPGGPAGGGAICNLDAAEMVSCIFQGNAADGGSGGSGSSDQQFGGGGGDATAGAIDNYGMLKMKQFQAESNKARGGVAGYGYSASPGGIGRGGALSNKGTASVEDCHFQGNWAAGGGSQARKHRTAGASRGGAIHNEDTLEIHRSIIIPNHVYSSEACGGGIYHAAGTLSASLVQLRFNATTSSTAGDTYYGGDGFHSFGGGMLVLGAAALTNCLFLSNSVAGGPPVYEWAPGPGGSGFGGGLASRGQVALTGCSFVGNTAAGSSGAYARGWVGYTASSGGGGGGGGIALLGGACRLVNSTITECLVVGAHGGNVPRDAESVAAMVGGSGGFAYGAGVFTTNSLLEVLNSTLARNMAIPGLGGTSATNYPTMPAFGPTGAVAGAGIALRGTNVTQLHNSIVAENQPSDTDGDYQGTANLVTAVAGLGSLRTNMLGTFYLPLLPGSPAIDAGLPVPALSTDQNEVSRPFGPRYDLGAVEWTGPLESFMWSSLRILAGQAELRGMGPAHRGYLIQRSEDLVNWLEVFSGATDASGTFQFSEPAVSPTGAFYRVLEK